MAIEAARRCGYRQVGGLYLVAPGPGESCELLPAKVTSCPHCGSGIKPARGWTWISAEVLEEATGAPCKTAKRRHCRRCFLCRPELRLKLLEPADRFGLLWVGDAYYTPASFLDEAKHQGISRRIAAIPRGFVFGKTCVLLAHRKATADEEPGIFQAFVPQAVELLVTPSMRQEDWVRRYERAGVRLVEVPEGDADHTSRSGHAKRAAPILDPTLDLFNQN